MVDRIKESNQVSYFKFYFQRLKWKIPALLALSAIGTVLDGVGLVLFVPLFHFIRQGEADTVDMGGFEFILETIESLNIEPSFQSLLIVIVSLFLMKAIIGYFRSLYSTKVNARFAKNLRIQVLHSLCNVSYPAFTGMESGRIQNVASSQTGKATGGLGALLIAIQACVMLVAYLGLAFMVNFRFALLVVITGVLANLIYVIINRKVEAASYEQSVIGHDVQSGVLETVWNYKYLKATGIISDYRRRLSNLITRDETISLKMDKIYAVSDSMVEPVAIVLVSLIIFVQVRFYDASIYGIVIGLLFFYRALTSMFSVQNSWQYFLSCTGGIRAVTQMLGDLDDKQESTEMPGEYKLEQSISFNNISFSYGSDTQEVLRNLSIEIKKDTTVALVGESGSGKTTIVNMLAGLLVPDSGHVLVDGVELDYRHIIAFRESIGYVTQESVVFNDTVYNNVAYGYPKSPENLKRFWDVIEKTALTSTIMNMPNNEDSLLGDYGMLISGGQKQRIAISRELFRDCSLLLLDEATSSLDTENENMIQANINALKGEYTMVIIAHRLSTIKQVDKIFLLDKGEITASGSFGELMERSDRFRKMVMMQDF